MSGIGNVTVSPGQSAASSTIDFTFAAYSNPVFSTNGENADSGSTWTNTVFSLDTDTNGWSPNENSYAIIRLGTLTLPMGEPGTGTGSSTCGICNLVASLKLTVGSSPTVYTISTPNSPVVRNSSSSVTITPNGSALDPSTSNQAKYSANYLIPGGTLRVWLYTSQNTGSWDPFTLNNSDRTQDVWMKVWLVPAPEPASMALAGVGLLALGYAARRRQTASKKSVSPTK